MTAHYEPESERVLDGASALVAYTAFMRRAGSETCRCGAEFVPFSVSLTGMEAERKAFREAHATCRAPVHREEGKRT